MRKNLIVGNWKMNGSLAANAELLAALKAGFDAAQADLALCAPAPYLLQLQAALQGSGID